MRNWLILIIISFFAFFVNNEALIPDIMESRNIITAREMVSESNWMVPTMNGELRLEKPPLPTWVAGVIEKASPDNLSLQRAAAGVMGTMLVLFFYLLIDRLSRSASIAFLSSLILLTCYQIVLMGRTATWDIYCHAFMMGGIYYLYRAFYDWDDYLPERPWLWFPLAGLFMGLSFLSKGPVSFYALLLPFLIAVFAYRRPSLRGRTGAFIAMLVVCLVVSAWWYGYLMLRHPEELSSVLGKETGAWVNRTVRPWYYYWSFFAELGAWALWMLFGLFIPYWMQRVTHKREYLIAIVWTLSALVLLSFMPEKKMRYLLPMMMPCSFVVGVLLWELDLTRDYWDRISRFVYRFSGGLLSLVVLALPVVTYVIGYRPGHLSLAMWLFTAVLFVVLGAWLVYATVRSLPFKFVYGIVALFLVAETFLISSIGGALSNPEFHSIAEARDLSEVRDLPFYHAQGEYLRIEMVYAAHRRVLPLDLADSAAVMQAVPCAVIVQHPIGTLLAPQLQTQLEVHTVGLFDDNRHARTDKHYNLSFLNYLVVLRHKQ